MAARVKLLPGEGEWLLMHFIRPPGSTRQVRKLVSTHTTDRVVAEGLRVALERALREAPRPAPRPTPTRERPVRAAFTNGPRIVRA